MLFGLFGCLMFFKWKVVLELVCLLCDMFECLLLLFGIYKGL